MADDAVDPPDEYDAEFTLELAAADRAFEKALRNQRQHPRKKDAHLVVVSHGTYMMGRPVPQEPSSESAVLNNLICREELDPSGPLPPPSPTIVGLQAVSDAIADGGDLAPFRDNIERVVSNQPEKGELLRSYIDQADKEALVDMVVMRANSLKVIKQASLRHDLHLPEAIVVWRLSNEQIPVLKKGVGMDEKAVDFAGAITKIDYGKRKIAQDIEQRWEGTTPQGRELIRKKLWEIKREVEIKQGIYPPGVEPREAPEPPEDEPDTPPPPLPPITLAHPA